MARNERIGEWRHHQWRRRASVSIDMRWGVCLFQINRPYNDALKDNLRGIKDRRVASAQTAHPETLNFPRLILFYSVYYLFTRFHLSFPSLPCDLQPFSYLLVWPSYLLTTMYFLITLHLSLFIFLCPIFISPQLHFFLHPPLLFLSLSLYRCHCASCVMSQGLISGGQPLSRWQPEQQLPGGCEGGW